MISRYPETMEKICHEKSDFKKDEISILEPSVGAGGFIPYIIKRYE